MRYAYPSNIVLMKKREYNGMWEAYGVKFPDVYGANTCGDSWEEAIEMAEDVLGPRPGVVREGK